MKITATPIAFSLLFVFLAGIIVTYASDYYWIGGTGNWSDINHWAESSGGSVLHNTPPTADDDVFFDANSFNAPGQKVYVNAENAVCRNLDWTGAQFQPELTNSNSQNLRIFGSLTLIEDMVFNYDAAVTFEAPNTGNTIKTAGHSFLTNIYFEGIGGEWTLLDTLKVNGSIFFNHGSLITNNQTVHCTGFYSSSPNERTIILGHSHIFTQDTWFINAENLTLQANNSTITTGTNFTTNSGEIIEYNRVEMKSLLAKITNNAQYVRFDTVIFFNDGFVNGDCYINYLDFNLKGVISDNDTIKYVRFGIMDFSKISGNHIIDTAIFLSSGEIEGSSRIDTCYFKGKSVIKDNNTINRLFSGDTANVKGNNIINHSFYNKMVYFRGNNTVQYAYLNCDGDFGGENTFDTLIFSPGFQYIFEISKTQTINNVFSIQGTCEKPIWLKSSYSGANAKIKVINGPVQGEHLSLRDMEAAGAIPFNALQTVNLGNNKNWTIDELQPRELYWVNGSGNWTDSNHWDTSQGGSGGECPPTELDNVYFPGTTGQISVNIRNAVCHNMDWSGAGATFTGDDTLNLVIYGSLKLVQGMDYAFKGEVHFEDTTGGQTVEQANQTFLNNVRFQGSYGGWELVDNFNCTDTIFHDRGTLDAKEDIESFYFYVRDTCFKELFLHDNTLLCHGTGETISVNGFNLELHADSSLLKTDNYAAFIRNYASADRMIYNNVIQLGDNANIINEAYCVFNVVEHFGENSYIKMNCTIDTAIFYKTNGNIFDSDTIKTAIFHQPDGWLTGNHVVEIAYYYDLGYADGTNKIDTALFYKEGNIIGKNVIDTTIIYNDAYIKGGNTIRTATLLDKGTFEGNNTFDDLTLTYAKKYFFQHDSTQTINENFNANGRCTGNIILLSDFDGKRAILKKTNGTVEITYANIRDIQAAGNVPFVANNSVDLGNNEGWQINSAESIALYWVGGNGVWSDSTHWAPVSGGEGGYCIPSPVDDVYFDDSSFYQPEQGNQVTIDIENATCRNMSWAGSDPYEPVFSGDFDNELFIYGSLLFNENLNIEYYGNTYFESREEGNTIDMKGTTLNADAVFRGRGGGWTLTGNFATNSSLILEHGSLITDGYEIKCYSLESTDTTVRALLLDTSFVFALTDFQINTKNLTFDPDSAFLLIGSKLTTFNYDSTISIKYKDTIIYDDVTMLGGAIINDSVYCYYDNVKFNTAGAVNGDCYIDTIVFTGSGTINDNDTINYALFKQSGTVNGGHHIIGSALFEGTGTINGESEIGSAIFNSNGSVSGSNIIDTTIIYGNGNITGSNIFHSNITIFGDGNIFGTNNIQNKLVIHGLASIYQENEIYDALLLGWGNIGGTNNFDILTLTPGKTYTFASQTTQNINAHLNIRGNNCFPVTVRSSNQNVQANLYMPENADTVSGDFIIMRDINATGGNTFFAGGNSNNISGNTGWIWDNAPGYIYGLEFDTVYMCSGSSYTITTDNFNPNDSTKFLWDDGTISPTYTVTAPGTYQVTAIYSNNCSVTDDIYVGLLPAPELDLGADTSVCEGEKVQFESDETYPGYLWQDGSTGESVTATNTGYYWLEVTGENGCKTRDSVYLTVLPSPHPDIGNDTILHNGEFILLDAGYPGAGYLWSTGDTTQTIEAGGVEGGETYWVEVYYQGCPGYDTVVIDEYPYCTADVPTAFSPNNDKLNDILYVRGSGIKELDFRIYNRYGELVFETDDMSKGWDGTVDGIKQEEEVYVYYLYTVCFDGLVTEKKGNITLLR